MQTLIFGYMVTLSEIEQMQSSVSGNQSCLTYLGYLMGVVGLGLQAKRDDSKTVR